MAPTAQVDRSATALVAEDEAVLRAELCGHLQALWPGLRIVGQAANGVEALQLMQVYRPDVLFLDIQMPGLTGIEVARQAEHHMRIVFITAYDAHAVAAFEQGAIDYVLKPYEVPRLAASVRRLRERLHEAQVPLDDMVRAITAAVQRPEHLRWIKASQGSEVRLITVDEVCYFQADSKYTLVMTADGGEALMRTSLRELTEQLDPAVFWQVHRSTIVNANAIASVRRDLRGRVLLKLRAREESVPVSEQHEHLFRQM